MTELNQQNSGSTRVRDGDSFMERKERGEKEAGRRETIGRSSICLLSMDLKEKFVMNNHC